MGPMPPSSTASHENTRYYKLRGWHGKPTPILIKIDRICAWILLAFMTIYTVTGYATADPAHFHNQGIIKHEIRFGTIIVAKIIGKTG